jgi:hypothetical protein
MDKGWIPNYGVWIDEIDQLGLRPCLLKEWPVATVFMGTNGDEKITLKRPYGRMDRKKFKEHMMSRCKKSGVRLEALSAEGISHSATESLLSVGGEGDVASTVRCKLLVDCSGYGKAFVKYDAGKEPGVQAAYGIEAIIKPGSYPFPDTEMLLMDYRDVYMQDSSLPGALPSDAAEVSISTFCTPDIMAVVGRGQYLYFCNSKASKLSTKRGSLSASPPSSTACRQVCEAAAFSKVPHPNSLPILLPISTTCYNLLHSTSLP